jgi:hypothetical protein
MEVKLNMAELNKAELEKILSGEFPELIMEGLWIGKKNTMTDEELIHSVRCIKRDRMIQDALKILSKNTRHRPIRSSIIYQIDSPALSNKIIFRVDNIKEGDFHVGSLQMYNSHGRYEDQIQLIGFYMPKRYKVR